MSVNVVLHLLHTYVDNVSVSTAILWRIQMYIIQWAIPEKNRWTVRAYACINKVTSIKVLSTAARVTVINPLMARWNRRTTDHYTCSNRVIDTLTGDGWAVIFGIARRFRPSLIAVPNVTAHLSTANVLQLHIIWHGTIIRHTFAL